MVLNNVKAEMARNGMTIKELSEKLGVSYSATYNWINGHSKVPAYEVKRMAEIFGVSMDYIMEVKLSGKVEGTASDTKT